MPLLTGRASSTVATALAALLVAAASLSAQQADLQVQLRGADTVWVGYAALHVVTVKNLGPAAAANVRVRYQADSAVTLTAANNGQVSGTTVTWTAPSLAPGDSLTESLTVHVSRVLTTGIAATAESATPDPAAANNDATNAAGRISLVARREALAKFNAIRTPTAPAFAMLGVEPTAIERPNNPADVGLALANAVGDFSTLPKDFAIQVSPFWLTGHPRLTWEADDHRTVWQSLARTFTLSAGTAQTGTVTAPVTGVAVGFRTSVLSGHMGAASRARLNSIRLSLRAENTASLNRLAPHLDTLRLALLDSLGAARSAADTGRALQWFNEEKKAAQRRVVDDSTVVLARARTDSLEIPDRASTREGLFLDLAGGIAFDAPSGAADSVGKRRLGAWGTLGYSRSGLSVLALARYLTPSNDSLFDSVDFGSRLIYATGKAGLSIEALGRVFQGTGAPSAQWRMVGAFEYLVLEGTWAQVTFGRDFDVAAAGSLIARLGLSANLSQKRYTLEH